MVFVVETQCKQLNDSHFFIIMSMFQKDSVHEVFVRLWTKIEKIAMLK